MTARASLALPLVMMMLTGGPVHGQMARDASPAQVVSMFFEQPTFPDEGQYVTGEFAVRSRAAPSIGSALPSTARVSSRALDQSDTSAVFATAVRQPGGRDASDWYTYLRKVDGRWKIAAMRTLLLPTIFFRTRDSLTTAPFLSADGASMLARMQLVTRSDSALRELPIAQGAVFRRLVDTFLQQTAVEAVDDNGRAAPAAASHSPIVADLSAQLRAAHMGAIYREPDTGGCLFVKIGGAAEYRVGYVFAVPGCHPPRLDAESYMYVEAVAPNWYLYKSK